MKKVLLVLVSIICCFFLSNIYGLRAEDEASSATDLKQELAPDKPEAQEQYQETDQDLQEGRIEENQLREQIKVAIESGDLQAAEQLKEQLRVIHTGNMETMMEYKQAQQDKQDSNPTGLKGELGANPAD
jgi:hypothetical protein